ncbi:sensor histidine kinase [Bdellovibrio reynosensis]|uniref:histidine kinase n=1 Tax=Bdellovibrio reynosensis TaxID=2835041 RepID=A0ABY4C7Y5_9BACT|nr:HAMP domain-containing sensor histidine kinase [Bdellovibrio reynosensis]UOF01103.1 ATP-binding protein [Bdellovibrio reynosensis]
MKVKLIAVLVAIATVFIGAVLWRTDSFVYGDRLSWVEAQTRTQLGSINNSLAAEFKSLQRVITTFNAENFQKGKLNFSSLSPYYAAASFSLNGSELEPQTILAKENSKAANWTPEFVKAAVGTIPERTADLRFFVKPFQDSQQGRYVALIFIEGNRAYGLFGSGEIFQSLIDAQRGALSSFSIVTTTGLTVGHSVPEYLGTVMRDDPVFRDAQKSGASHGSNTFKLKSGELYGMYEKIPATNLVVLSSAPLTETMKGRSGLWWQYLLMGLGLVAVGVAAILFVTSSADKESEDLQAQLQALKAKPMPAPVQEKVMTHDPELVQKEKVEASMRVASALAHEMRGPLASILGYSQMILAKTPESDIVQSTDSILRETRAARGVLDKLLGFAGEEVKEKNSLKVEGPLVKALKSVEGLLSQKGVKLTKNIQDTSALDLHADAIIRAISNILHNSVEAMERMANKEIKVSLFEENDGVHLEIEDSGEGIEAQNLEKIFDPFFTTRSFHNHMGLGLSVAFGIFKEHGADVKVESKKGQGTKMSVIFKKVQTASVLKAPEVKEDEVIIATELPQLKDESPARVEAEEEFAQVQLAPSTPAPASPLDVNIDKMLEFPEAHEVAAPVEPSEPVAAASEVAETKKPIPPPPANSSSFNDDEFSFIDGFNEPAKAAAPVQAPVLETAEVGASGPTGAELATMDDELTPVNLINPPKMAMRQKVSKLDSYHVEIRRPGKRL